MTHTAAHDANISKRIPPKDVLKPRRGGAEREKMNTYDLFTGVELEIAEKIQQRRYQLLVHSCIYYYLNTNIISDMQWDKWAKELVKLQKDYPQIASQVKLFEYFNDWDGSTGAFLPITLDWVIKIAQRISGQPLKRKKIIKPAVQNKIKKVRLF